VSGDAVRRAELEAARLLLSKMGISPDELLGTPEPSAPAPTFGEYIPGLVKTVSPGSAPLTMDEQIEQIAGVFRRQLTADPQLPLDDLLRQIPALLDHAALPAQAAVGRQAHRREGDRRGPAR
jgi:hypothetical protein